MFFTRKATDVLYGVLLDIGSGSIGVGIVVGAPTEKNPHLIFGKRIPMRINEEQREVDELRKVQESLVTAALTLVEEGMPLLKAHNEHATLTHLHVSCTAPWSYTVARNVTYAPGNSFLITEAILTDLVHSAENEILTHIKDSAVMTKGTYEVVESATVDMRVNEYPVRDPLALTGVQLELTHLVGIIPTELLTTIKEVQQKLFSATKLHVHTSMLVMYCTLRDLFPKMNSVCIIDVTGEATEFGIVENNLLIENTSTAFGTATFVREVMRTTGKPYADIESDFLEYTEKRMDACADFLTVADKYTAHLKDVIANIEEKRPLSHNFIINVALPYAPYFSDMITHVIKGSLGKDAHIVPIKPEFNKGILEGSEGDTYLAFSARFFHKLHGCGE
jgi:hypothetical protein